MKNQYYISKISASGTDQPTSSIDFKPGMNIIYGPSNTGKSYVFSCIRYVLGSNDFPIAEELGFDEFCVTFSNIELDGYIEITRQKNKQWNIFSTIPEVRSGKYKRDDYLSIVLNLMGIEGHHEIYKTKSRKSQAVTYNSFAHFFMIDEERIFTKSPVLSPPKFPNIIAGLSLLNFLLFGKDANSEKPEEDLNTKKIQRAAVRGYIRKKISALSSQKADLEVQLSKYNINHDAEAILESYDEELKEMESMINAVTEQNKENLSVMNALGEKYQEASITLDRYKNLQTQYEADLKRLEFIIDGAEVKELFTEPTRCPFCDNELHDEKHEEDCIKSAKAEYAKTEQLLSDLKIAYRSVENEAARIRKEYLDKKLVSDRLSDKIERILKPRVRELSNVLELYKNRTEIKKQLEMLEIAASDYESEIKEQNEEEKKDQEFDPRLSLDESFVEPFEKALKKALKISNYPGLLTCIVDPVNYDPIVNEKRKENDGKGYRAYLNSIYSSTLFRYIIENGRYAPFSLVLDSPVLSLKEDIAPSERIDSTMRAGLFRYLESCASAGQVIIIENEIPEIDYSEVNLIHFTKREREGRYGFLLDVRD